MGRTYLNYITRRSAVGALGGGALGSGASRLPRIVLHPEDFKGENVTDTSAWQAAIDHAAAAGGGLVRARAASYTLQGLSIRNSDIELDFNYARIDFEASGTPLISVRGRERARFTGQISSATQISAKEPLDRAALSKSFFIVGQKSYVPRWLDCSADERRRGYWGRWECQRGELQSDHQIKLETGLVRTYGEVVDILAVEPVEGFVVRNIGNINQDIARRYIGAFEDNGEMPVLIGVRYADRPSIDNINVADVVLHAVNVQYSLEPRVSRVRVAGAKLPQLPGHGYGVRVDRCRSAIVSHCKGAGLRHLVDDVQSVGTNSVRNHAARSSGSSFSTHGHDCVGFSSIEDRSEDSLVGWSIGNGSFSGDRQVTILRPFSRGDDTAVLFCCGSSSLSLEKADFARSGSRPLLMCAGASGLSIVGGSLEAGPTGNAINVRPRPDLSRPEGATCRDVCIAEVKFLCRAEPAVGYMIDIAAVGDIRVGGNDFSACSSSSARVRVERQPVGESECRAPPSP